jgi:hypothetical protein
MFRHVAVFTWTGSQTEEQVQALADALAALPAAVPGIREFHFGPDAGLSQSGCDYAVVADFDGTDGYLAYRDHPAHRELIEQYLRPILGHRCAVQYEL